MQFLNENSNETDKTDLKNHFIHKIEITPKRLEKK
jgi:hypothetical protein